MILALLICAVTVIILAVQVARKNRELSRLKRRTEELGRQAATLSTIYYSIPDIVFSKDMDSVYTSCNPHFEKFAGCSETKLKGKTDAELFGIDQVMAELFIEADRQVIRGEKTVQLEEWITYPDGTRRLVDTKKTPVYRDGEVIGMIGISRDITERKAAEEAKSQFIAHMSHEIRTPLNAIIGFSQIVRKSMDNKVLAQSYIDKVITSSQHLMGILNDVLDISKIDSGKMEISSQPFILREACQEINSMIQQRCDEKHITYVQEMNISDDLAVAGDKLRLSQSIINLLANAVKFTYDGTVYFRVSILRETEQTVTLYFEVEDTGIGMTEEQIDRLFVAFDQTDDSVAARFGGTGLGLYISQRLIQQMGGLIEVESMVDRGSRFYFTLTMPRADHVHVEKKEDIRLDLSGKCILLVEDIETNRLVVQAMLEETGVAIVEAEDGVQAVKLFSESKEGFFDLIFMDVQMPNMNGYDAARVIRNSSHPQARSISIFAMSANSYQEDIQKSLDSGMNGHISKPVDYTKLMKLLDEAMSALVKV